MANIKDKFKSGKKSKEPVPFEKAASIQKLSLLITIVNQGQGDLIMFMLAKSHVSASYLQRGQGTASQDLYEILGINDSGKEIIYSLVPSSYVKPIMKDLDDLFSSAHHESGISLAISLKSLAGITAYKFLSQSI